MGSGAPKTKHRLGGGASWLKKDLLHEICYDKGGGAFHDIQRAGTLHWLWSSVLSYAQASGKGGGGGGGKIQIFAAETGPGDSDVAGPRAVVHFSFCEEELGIQLSWARIQTTLSSVCRALFVVRVFYFGRFQKKMACVFLFCLLVFTWRFVVYLLPGQCFIAGVP